MEEMWLANNVTPELFIFCAFAFAIVIVVMLIRDKINERKNKK